MKLFKSIAVCFFLSTGVANANLIFGVIDNVRVAYDDIVDKTYITDGNYAKTSGYNYTGEMSQDTAKIFAANVVVGSASDWGLLNASFSDASCSVAGTIFQPTLTFGFGCENEATALFAALGGVAGANIFTVNNDDFDLFTNIQPAQYWLEDSNPYNINQAYDFNFIGGWTGFASKNKHKYVLLSHDGNPYGLSEEVADVPEPSTLVLFGLGLLGMGFTRKKLA